MTSQEFFTRWWFSFSNVGARYFLMAGTVFLLFYILFKSPMMGRKIQPKFPKMTDYGRDIFYSLISMVVFGVVSVITFGILKPFIMT
jgi:Delta7-sterol 5-desaturase